MGRREKQRSGAEVAAAVGEERISERAILYGLIPKGSEPPFAVQIQLTSLQSSVLLEEVWFSQEILTKIPAIGQEILTRILLPSKNQHYKE